MSNLFIVSTPRHWLLAVYLNQVVFSEQKSVILLAERLVQDRVYLDLAQTYFDVAYVLKDTQDWLEIRFVKKLFRTYGFEQVFSGPVRDSYAQYAAFEANKPQNKGFYLLDDGLFSYHRIDVKKVKFTDYWLRKGLWGSWYQKQADYRLECPWVSGAYLCHRNLLQCETVKPVHYTASDWLQALQNLGVVQKLAAFYDLSANDFSEVSALLVLGVSKDLYELNPAYPVELSGLVDRLHQSGRLTLIKPHPREKQINPLALKEGSVQPIILPQGLPFEVLMTLLPQKVLVVGDISTTLLDFKLFRPDARVVAVTNYLQDESNALLSKAELEIVETYPDISRL